MPTASAAMCTRPRANCLFPKVVGGPVVGENLLLAQDDCGADEVPSLARISWKSSSPTSAVVVSDVLLNGETADGGTDHI